MSKFGWDLPPGCTHRMIEEAACGNADEEAFFELMFEQLPPSVSEADQEKLIDWAWKQMGEAYARGYQDGQSDAELANEYRLAKAESK